MNDQPTHKPSKPRKYKNTKSTTCIGCGSLHTHEFRQPVCIFHKPENVATLQEKLHSPVIEFISKPKNSHGRSEGACELVTLMEMLVIPDLELEIELELEPEEMPSGFSPGVDIDHPRFSPPSATFPEVVNLTFDFSPEALQELGGRLFEYFEHRDEGYYNGQPKRYHIIRPEFADTCRFDLKSRFPNLKLLTIVERDGIKSGLTNLFLLPPSLRVLRTNKNVFNHNEYSEFLSNVPRLSDVLIDFKMHDAMSANEEPSLKRKDVLKNVTELEVENVNLSVVPKLRRLRFTDMVITGKFNPAKPVSLKLERALELCSFLEETHAPSSLESLEFPASSNFIKVNMACAPFRESRPEKPFERLLANFRCVFPRKVQCVDVSCPYSEGPRALDTWEQKRYIILLVDAFERCYFEDVVSRRLHHLCVKFRNPSAAKSAAPRVAVENSENLKRNLRMFLGGTQFRLPDTFADKVIYQVELRFSDALRTVASELSLSQASLNQMSNTGDSVVEVKRNKQMQLMIGKRMESSYFSSYFEALRPKLNIFTQKHANPNTEPRSCGCNTCQIVMSAGIDKDLNTAARIPFSISGIRSMEEYDAMFDSMRRGRGSPRSPHSPSPRHTPRYGSRNRRTRSRNPSPGYRPSSKPRSNDEGSPKSGGSIRRRGTKRMQKHRHVKRTHRTRK